MGTSESQSTTATKLKRIAALSAGDRHRSFDSLMHHFNVASLTDCFHQLDGRKAVGIDGVTKASYAAELARNLQDLLERMKQMAYRPGPVRQVRIPKEGKAGATRPLGISNLEDKIVQKMMQRVLESIYEPVFRTCSYGFRPGRSPHDAIRALLDHLYRHEVEVVIDVDIASYFDTIDHSLLAGFLAEKIRDKRFMRYLHRMLKAGVLAEGELTVSDEGVPQGSICSPILANVFAHHVIDTWMEEVVQPRCAGRVALFRYADDMIICCAYERDAHRIRRALGKRLAKYHLRLNDEKTRMVFFSKRAQRPGGRSPTFSFLGFTFYWGRSRRGVVIPKLKSEGSRQRRKLQRVNEWARTVRNRYGLAEIWQRFGAKLGGHIQYYGVLYNLAQVYRFRWVAVRILFKWLNRRSQRKSFTWEQFGRYMGAHPLPPVRTCQRLF